MNNMELQPLPLLPWLILCHLCKKMTHSISCWFISLDWLVRPSPFACNRIKFIFDFPLRSVWSIYLELFTVDAHPSLSHRNLFIFLLFSEKINKKYLNESKLIENEFNKSDCLFSSSRNVVKNDTTTRINFWISYWIGIQCATFNPIFF